MKIIKIVALVTALYIAIILIILKKISRLVTHAVANMQPWISESSLRYCISLIVCF